MSLVNFNDAQDRIEVCHSYCNHCRVTTAWKIKKNVLSKRFTQINGVANTSEQQLSCAKCYNPLDLSGKEIEQLNTTIAQSKSIQGTAIHQELNHRIERRQQAFNIASRGNWLTG